MVGGGGRVLITEKLFPRGALRRLLRRRPRLLACFSYRYDAHLVPALLENIAPLVEGWVAFDDRGRDGLFTSEPARRRLLLERARALGAGWVLAVDPDERFESGVAAGMARLLRAEGPVVWTFRLRELYAADRYRVDGVWGEKRAGRLFPLREGQRFSEAALHAPWHATQPPPLYRHSDFNLYHLKMILPERRRARRDLYNHLDAERRFQALGYDYLAEEAGAALEEIPPGRGYSPPHHEDGGLWMAPVTKAEQA